MIGNDCTGCCTFNYHTTTTAQVQLRWKVIALLILMELMIITVYKLSLHINQWKELIYWKYAFCWCSLDGFLFLMWSSINCRHNVIHIRTIPGYLFFCHQTGMVDHWILRLHTFYKCTHVEFKTLSTVETLTPKHKQTNK